MVIFYVLCSMANCHAEEWYEGSYEHKCLILTTNLPFSEWGKIVADEQLAAAMIDRIVHFGHLIDTGKVYWRLRLSPMNHQMVKKKVN